jgi:hypothetical protein
MFAEDRFTTSNPDVGHHLYDTTLNYPDVYSVRTADMERLLNAPKTKLGHEAKK